MGRIQNSNIMMAIDPTLCIAIEASTIHIPKIYFRLPIRHTPNMNNAVNKPCLPPINPYNENAENNSKNITKFLGRSN